MTPYIVLFRGVGGATQLPVKQLRAVLTEAGFSGVATYINSGNAVLASPLAESAVAETVAALVKEKMGFDKAVLVRSAADWAEAIAKNPFVAAVDEPTKLHLLALERQPEARNVEALQAKATGSERFAVKGRTLYLHTPDGMGRSLFAPKIEPTLKVAGTARNWRTVLALARMADNL
ncbi:DUF1697 domain-containing protein [Chelativorans sp. M5D2P16]|uniref:DUF1697 domain-containing protein n=1 Tax=Chelativorans sp. M5D2P16 TaxID=3095678 RepID=UPI002ACA0510|nr:DUF1697 domain-containing protein [Chelativorans sp. M5D2P16]MDZ5696343.1 DUF1697 domain-containing protein [Chelativorans sp. M5D2P16]